MLSTLLTVLLVIVSLILLVLVVALQQGNEGGIGSAFGSGNSAGFFGASGGVNFIVRATWICGALFFILSMSLAWIQTRDHFGVSRELDSSLIQEAPSSSPKEAAPAAPSAPATKP